MRNEEHVFLRKCVMIAVIAMAATLVVVWVLDTMFNGTLLNFFSMLFITPSIRGSVRTSLLGYGIVLMLFVSLVCVVVAYRTYISQHALYVEAKAEADRAKALAETEAQRKSDLITYLAHDLRTPLASVIAYLSLLDESPDLAPDQRARFVGVTLDKANRLERLIDELFEIIRFSLQSITMNEERISLRFMLEQLADEFYPILLPHSKTIRVSCEEGLTLRGDSDKLARVFNNILKNASAYSYDNTQITITVHQNEDGTEIHFENHGDPIPRHKQDVIFEKFYRLDASRASKTGGVGLGLAIAKEIVEAHGGSISVNSDAASTVFTVVIPASQ
ncbi:MAG: GHKL domain-containing protein [Oscillospiraceae bacterium]|nr:GHKL domain-containing protein [Oscillospiraceae bacterium]